jgi:hypothetical protein
MPMYDDLVQLARLCMQPAEKAKLEAVTAELQRMAEEYHERAAGLDDGKLPRINDV